MSPTLMTPRESIEFDKTTLNALQKGEKPEDVLSALGRLQQDQLEQVTGNLTLDSSIEEVRLSAIRVMTTVAEQTLKESGPGAREECAQVIAYLHELQTKLDGAWDPTSIPARLIYGTTHFRFDPDCVEGVQELQMTLQDMSKNFKKNSSLVDNGEEVRIPLERNWKEIIAKQIRGILEPITVEMECYPAEEAS